MMITAGLRSLVGLGVLLCLAGCGREEEQRARVEPRSPAPEAPAPTEAHEEKEEESILPSALVGEWILVALAGEPIEVVEGERFGGAPTLRAEANGQTGGAGGINRWSGSIEIEDLASGACRFTPIITTMMAGPPEAMEREAKFLKGLGETASFDPELLGEGVLVFRLESGDEILRFERKP